MGKLKKILFSTPSLFILICVVVYAAQVAIVDTDTLNEAWTKETNNNSDLQTNIDGKEGTLTNSAGLAAAISDETGTGVVVYSTSPTLVTPELGVATATSIELSPSATPTSSFADSDSLDADQTICQIFANATTVTAGAVVSNMTFTYKDGGDASGVFTPWLILDGSDNQAEFQIDTTFQDNDITENEIASPTIDVNTVIAGALVLDASNSEHTVVIDQNVAITFTGWPSTGQIKYIGIRTEQTAGDYTVTIGGVAVDLTASGNDTVVAYSGDGGVTVNARVADSDIN